MNASITALEDTAAPGVAVSGIFPDKTPAGFTESVAGTNGWLFSRRSVELLNQGPDGRKAKIQEWVQERVFNIYICVCRIKRRYCPIF